jgi:chorismate dehydratase
MSALRLGAVAYLNARPLVHGLAADDRFSIRFDLPARCAALLHEGAIDLGLIPSIEYLRQPDYRIVPGIAIASDGPVASVALFSTRPIATVRTIGVDSSSRTSVALLRILCARRFDIAPSFITQEPDLTTMVDECDAALVVGDPALVADHEALGLHKIDLGTEWKAMTGLPFVYAFWTGRPGHLQPGDIEALHAARDGGVRQADAIGRAYYPGDEDRGQLAAEYLRDNIKYHMGERERAGLATFYELASELGVAPGAASVRFFE